MGKKKYKKYKDVSLAEIRKVFDDIWNSTPPLKRTGEPYVKDVGNGMWEISTGYTKILANNAGKAMFDKAIEEWATKELEKAYTPELKKQMEEEFKKYILYGK